MARVFVVVDVGLLGFEVFGRPLTAWWTTLLAAAGHEAVFSASDADPGAPSLNGAYAATPLAALRAGRFHAEGPALQAGEPESVFAVTRAVRAAVARSLAQAGVHLVDPERVDIEPWVEVGRGARIWPDVVLRGQTRLAAGVEVRPGCWLEDTVVEEGASILPHSVLTGAVVGPGAAVGPMAHLRPGAVLEGKAKVGNFVEVKNTRLGKGAKASHLSYLGDAEVGEGANVGAGTITCNYDGFRKHRTEIGAGAFIGSNSALVAPIRIGAGAIIGAGSVITRDIAPDALAVERAPLKVLEGKARVLNDRNRRESGKGGNG